MEQVLDMMKRVQDRQDALLEAFQSQTSGSLHSLSQAHHASTAGILPSDVMLPALNGPCVQD